MKYQVRSKSNRTPLKMECTVDHVAITGSNEVKIPQFWDIERSCAPIMHLFVLRHFNWLTSRRIGTIAVGPRPSIPIRSHGPQGTFSVLMRVNGWEIAEMA